MNRTTLINSLIQKIDGKSYLEIGVAGGGNLKKIKCDKKVGVEPVQREYEADLNIIKTTSDDFFESCDEYFDLIFIDGLHRAVQVEKDILNALDVLREDGFIVCHDINPEEEAKQLARRRTRRWNGDCWKAWVKLRASRLDLQMFVVDCDEGCGVIRWLPSTGTNYQQLIDISETELNWENLVENRKKWLNLISVEDFENNKWEK